MHILQIASEISHCAKVGGLGDVIYGLSKELKRQGHTVQVLIPKYDCLFYQELKNLKPIQENIWSAELEDLDLLLFDSADPEHYFQRGVIYGCPDDIKRFTHFCKGAVDYVANSNKKPDIIHIHDWMTAAIAPLCKKQIPKPPKTILTIHNLQHQGIYGSTNLLEEGIMHADRITTVSPHYEQEIQTELGGCGLHSLLRAHRHKLTGILNGIDEDYWNPEQDNFLQCTYKTSSYTSILKGKAENRTHLRALLGLKEEKRPLVISITRLASQKSPELIVHGLRKTLQLSGQFVLLGSHPDPSYVPLLQSLEKEYADHPHVALRFTSNEKLAHLLFASADMILIPSLFEPCGLTQMIALRYGVIPLVRKTGGLADTVFDIDTSETPRNKRNGYSFDFPDTAGIDWVLDRAITHWNTQPKLWEQLVMQGLSYDWSWKKPVTEYLALYNSK